MELMILNYVKYLIIRLKKTPPKSSVVWQIIPWGTSEKTCLFIKRNTCVKYDTRSQYTKDTFVMIDSIIFLQV